MKILRKTGVVTDLYYISAEQHLDIVEPNIPNTISVREKLEDSKLKRILLAKDIDSALMIYGEGKNLAGQELHLYTPLGIRIESLIEPDITASPRTQITNEYWYLAPLQMRYITSIRVNHKDKSFQYGPIRKKKDINSWLWSEVMSKYQKVSKIFSNSESKILRS